MLDKSAMRKGAAAIKESVDKANSGGDREFKPFLRSIYWKGDEDNRYLLFLNEIEDIPKLLINGFIPDPDNDGWFTNALARTEPIVGERLDPMEEKWNYQPREMNVAIAVELEPQIEIVKGRERPRGFEVATTTFERKIRDDDGEPTDEIEEITIPSIGVIIQSPNNFGNQLTSFDANEAPLHECAVKVTRVGSGTDTAYSVQGYPDQEIDLSNLVEFVDGISYFGDRKDEVLESIAELSDEDAALEVGAVLLDLYIDELGDEDRYDHLFEGITENAKYGKKEKKDNKKRTRDSVRPSRPSQRKAAQEEPEADSDPEPVAKPKTRTKKAAPATDRMQELRERAAAKRGEVATA